MLIEAVQAGLLIKPADFSETKLCEMKFGDSELLVRLMGSKVPIATKMVDKLIIRALYDPDKILTYRSA